jgi:hypothetical protein
MIGGGVRGTRPQLLFKRNPVQCVFVAKSAWNTCIVVAWIVIVHKFIEYNVVLD